MDPQILRLTQRPLPATARHATAPRRLLTAPALAKGSGHLATQPQASTTDLGATPDLGVAALRGRKLGRAATADR